MIRVLLVDDESRARKVLAVLLSKYFDGIKIVGEAASAEEAYGLLQEKKIDLVFLDIEMPQEDGFSLLQRFDVLDFDVIFTTAFNQYALNAIKVSALDYLLKPIELEELKLAVEKYRDKRKASPNEIENIRLLPEKFSNLPYQNRKIVLPINKGLKVVALSDILYCESDRNYTIFNFNNQSKIVVGKNLKYFEQEISEFGFLRIHESFMVNIEHIDSYITNTNKGTNSEIVLSDGTALSISRTRKKMILQLLKG